MHAKQKRSLVLFISHPEKAQTEAVERLGRTSARTRGHARDGHQIGILFLSHRCCVTTHVPLRKVCRWDVCTRYDAAGDYDDDDMLMMGEIEGR